MSVFGPFIQEVPARIGYNAALDSAVAVLINAHTSLMYKKTSNDIVSINLYLRAIKTLQSCLEDSREGMSTNTLCASVILGLVEVCCPHYSDIQANPVIRPWQGLGRAIAT
jgi:hypothetical protein